MDSYFGLGCCYYFHFNLLEASLDFSLTHYLQDYLLLDRLVFSFLNCFKDWVFIYHCLYSLDYYLVTLFHLYPIVFLLVYQSLQVICYYLAINCFKWGHFCLIIVVDLPLEIYFYYQSNLFLNLFDHLMWDYFLVQVVMNFYHYSFCQDSNYCFLCHQFKVFVPINQGYFID